jgi:hypothetical protein
MTKEQIKECFDMDALSKGVKKEELYKYVNVDRMKNYFSEPQLADMMDMDFFQQSTKAAATAAVAGGTVAGGVMSRLGGSLKKSYLRSEAQITSDRTAKPTVAGVPEFTKEAPVQEKVDERVPQTFTAAAPAEKTVKELYDEEQVIEDIHELAHKDPFIADILKRLDPHEKRAFHRSLQNVVSRASKPMVQKTDAINGIIWSEILKRKSFGGQQQRGILFRR